MEQNLNSVQFVRELNALKQKYGVKMIRESSVEPQAETAPNKLSDPVNSPSHYQHGDIETIEIIRAMLTPEEYRGYLKGNILKYRERAPYKGKTDEDYAKAKRYYDWLREVASDR